MKIIIQLLVLSIMLLSACTTVENTNKTETTDNEQEEQEAKNDQSPTEALMSEDEISQAKKASIENCIGLVDTQIDQSATVIYEECGKNCLGGCPNSGPMFCYYGAVLEDNCMVFVKSRITGFPDPETGGTVFADYQPGELIQVSGVVELYENPYSKEQFLIVGE